uniref:RNA-dependent RNA polymerase n=1 Tax=Kashgar Reovi tick virus 1 TaxID=2972315 RepID=A0A9E7V268_9REOV|nr:MAG: RNA-dependent RNA polymerase [Kashgar Reovi tick virus 1]
MSLVQDFPFFYKITGVVPHRECRYLGANVPLLWWECLELMTQVSTGTITCRLENVLCSFWVKRAEENLFGRTFDNRDVFKNVREAILDKADLNCYRLFNLVPVSTTGKWWQEEEPDSSILNDIHIEDPSVGRWLKRVLTGPALTDRQARWFAVMLQFFYGPMLFVTGATSLSLEQSAQVQPGQKPVMRTIREEVDLDGEPFPIRHSYDDPDIQGVFNRAMSRVHKVQLGAINLESGFLEEQTTNSSGITEERLEELKDELRKLVRLENVHMITKVRQARIVDALYNIEHRFQDFESFIEGLKEWGKAGTRLQVNRRPRIIQMVRTCQQLVGYLIRLVLKRLYLSSPFASTGKNVGDVRDMEKALVISASPGLKSSNDIKGMDMSTKKPQVDFNFELAHEALSTDNNPGLRCFFTKSAPKGTVPVIVSREGVRISTSYSVCQYIVCLGRRAFEARTRFSDGYFQEHVETSARGFRSGWFPTSDNHNELGIETLEYIRDNLDSLGLEEFGVRSGQVQLDGSVAGDDQVLGVRVLGVTDSSVAAKVGEVVIRKLVSLMNGFGYICDPAISRHSAEFLKQMGVGGAPELFPSRLLLYTAERGDTSNVHVLGQIGVMMAMLREKVSRCPNSSGWVDYMIGVNLCLGSFTIVKSAGGRVGRQRFVSRYGAKEEYGQKVNFPASTGEWCIGLEWSSEGMRGQKSSMMVIPLSLWCVNHVQGAPPPPFYRRDGSPVASGSQYTIPSLSIYWQLIQAIKLNIQTDDLLRVLSGVSREMEGVGDEELRRVLIGLGYEDRSLTVRAEMLRLMIAQVDRLPVRFEWSNDTEALQNLNVHCGVWLAEKLPLTFTDRPARNEPLFRQWQEIGNGLLDRAKYQKSHLSAMRLRTIFGIDVPDSLAYYNRAGTRIDQALSQVTVVAQERLEEDVKVVRLISTDVRWDRIRRLLVLASFDVIESQSYYPMEHPIIVRDGWGHAVCPDSEVSWLVSALGVPDPREETYAQLSARFNDDLRLPGSVEAYVREAKKAIRAKGDAFQLFLDVVGLTPRDGDSLRRYIEHRGQLYDEVPFAHNPRQTFFYSLHPADIGRTALLYFDQKGRHGPNFIFCALALGSVVSMWPGLVRPRVRGSAGHEELLHPRYIIRLSPLLVAQLGRKAVLPL